MYEVWKKEEEVLDNTCKNKFRTRDDVNDWLFRHWQLMSGDFEPRRWDFGLLLNISENEKKIIEILKNPGKIRMLCINDTAEVENFENSKEKINKVFNKKFPDKSIFEK